MMSICESDCALHSLGSFSSNCEGNDDDDGYSNHDDHADHESVSIDLLCEIFEVLFSPTLASRYRLSVVSVSHKSS